MKKHGEFCWHELVSQDPEVAQTFYGSVFDWKTRALEVEGMSFVIFEDEEHIAHLTPGARSYWLPYINVEDIHACVEQALGLGAEILTPITLVPGIGTLAVLRDPLGVQLGIWQKHRAN